MYICIVTIQDDSTLISKRCIQRKCCCRFSSCSFPVYVLMISSHFYIFCSCLILLPLFCYYFLRLFSKVYQVHVVHFGLLVCIRYTTSVSTCEKCWLMREDTSYTYIHRQQGLNRHAHVHVWIDRQVGRQILMDLNVLWLSESMFSCLMLLLMELGQI